MPKKTKAQKIIAQYRRRLKLLEKINKAPILYETSKSYYDEKFSNDSVTRSKEKLGKSIQTDQRQKKIESDLKEKISQRNYFFSDFKKTVIISLIIIISIVLLSFIN